MKRRAHVFISGRVQGVNFRAHTQRRARALALDGFVRNLPDGRVEAVFEGDEERIKQMIDECRLGPPAASVDRVDVEWEEPQDGGRGFFIRY